jgi:hypothetical protein
MSTRRRLPAIDNVYFLNPAGEVRECLPYDYIDFYETADPEYLKLFVASNIGHLLRAGFGASDDISVVLETEMDAAQMSVLCIPRDLRTGGYPPLSLYQQNKKAFDQFSKRMWHALMHARDQAYGAVGARMELDINGHLKIGCTDLQIFIDALAHVAAGKGFKNGIDDPVRQGLTPAQTREYLRTSQVVVTHNIATFTHAHLGDATKLENPELPFDLSEVRLLTSYFMPMRSITSFASFKHMVEPTRVM